MEVRAVLSRIDLFAGLPAPALAQLAAFAFRRHLRRGETLFEEETGPAGFHVVESGLLKTTRAGMGGRTVLLDILGPGDAISPCCGAPAGPHACSASALTSCKIVWIRGPTWESVLKSSPRLRNASLELAAASRRRCADLVVALATQSVEGRLAALLERLQVIALKPGAPELGRILSHREMADAIGTVREVVTRHLAKFVEDGILERSGRQFSIARPDALRAIARSG